MCERIVEQNIPTSSVVKQLCNGRIFIWATLYDNNWGSALDCVLIVYVIQTGA